MIKAISKENIQECVNVIKESFKTVADTFGFTQENASRFTAFATSVERLTYQYEIEKRPMYACFENGRIEGYYSLQIMDNKECELNNICTLPSCRHKKIGEELITDAFEKARAFGCNKMNIGIVEENQLVKKWYQSFGFIHIGTKKFDFLPFVTGYMIKEL